MVKKTKKGITTTLGVISLTLLAGLIGASITTSLTLNIKSDQAIINNSIMQVQSNIDKFIKVKNNLKERFSAKQIVKDFTMQQVKKNIEITYSDKSIIFTITGKSLVTNSEGSSLILNLSVKKNNLVQQTTIIIKNFLKSNNFDTSKIDKLILNKPIVNLTTQAVKLQNAKTINEFINIFNALSKVEKNNYFSFGLNGVSHIDDINLKVISFALEKRLVATIEASKGEITKEYKFDFTSFAKKQKLVKKQNLDLAISGATEIQYQAASGATNLDTLILLDQIQKGFAKASDYFKPSMMVQKELLYKISKIEINSKNPNSFDLIIIVSALNQSLSVVQKTYKTSVGQFQTSKLAKVRAVIKNGTNQVNYKLTNDAKYKISVNEAQLTNYFTTFFKVRDDEKTTLDEKSYTYKIIEVREENNVIIPIVELSSIEFPQIKITYKAKAINKSLLLNISQRQKALFDLYALIAPNFLIESLNGNNIATILPSDLIITNFNAPILNKDLVQIPSIDNPSKIIDSYNDLALKNLFVPTLSFANENIFSAPNDLDGTVDVNLVLNLGAYKKSFKYIKINLFTESKRKENTLLSAAHSKICPTLKLISKDKLPSEIRVANFNILIQNGIRFEIINIIPESINDIKGKLIANVQATLLNENSITPIIYEVEINNLKNNKDQLIEKLNNFIAQQPVPLFKGNIGKFLAQQSGHLSIKIGNLENDQSGFFYNDYDVDMLKDKAKFMTDKTKNVLIEIQELKNFEIENGIVDIVINAFDRLPNGTKNFEILRQYEIKVFGFKKLAQFRAEEISATQLNVYKKAMDPIIKLKPTVDKSKISIENLRTQDFIFTSIDRINLKTKIGNIITKPNEPTTAIVQIRIIGFGKSANKKNNASSELIFEVEFSNFLSVSQQQNLNIINTFIKNMELNNAFIYPQISSNLHEGDIKKTRIDEINDPTKQLVFKPSSTINGNILEVLSFVKIDLESGTVEIKVTRLADNGKTSISRNYSLVLKGFVSLEDQINQIRLENYIKKGVKARVSVLTEIKNLKSISNIRKNEIVLIIPPNANNPHGIVFEIFKIVASDKDDTKAIITIRAKLATVFFNYIVEETGFLSKEKERLFILIQQKILSKELALTKDGQSHLAQEAINEHIGALTNVGSVSFKTEILKDNDDKSIVNNNKIKIKITATNLVKHVFASFDYFLGGFQVKAQDDVNGAEELKVSILNVNNIIGNYTKASSDNEQKNVLIVKVEFVIDMIDSGVALNDIFKIAPNNNSKVKYELISFTKNPSLVKEGQIKVRITSKVDETAIKEYWERFTFLTDLEFRRLTLLNNFIKDPIAKGAELGFKSVLPFFENDVSTFSVANLSLSDISLPKLEKNEDVNIPKIEAIISNDNVLITFRISPTSPTSIIFRIPIVVGMAGDNLNFKDFYEITVSGFKNPSKAFSEQALNDYVINKKGIRQDPTLITSKIAQKEFISGRTIISTNANFNLQKEVETKDGIIRQNITHLALVDNSSTKEIEITVAVSLGFGINTANNSYKIKIFGFASDKKENNFAKLQAFLAQESYPNPNLALDVSKSNYEAIDVIAKLANFIVEKQNIHPDVTFLVDSAKVKPLDETIVIITIKANVGEGGDEVFKTYDREISGFLTPAQFLNLKLAKNLISNAKNNPTLNSNIVKSKTSVNELTLKDFSIVASTNLSIFLKLVSVKPKDTNRRIAVVTTSVIVGKGTNSEVTISFTTEFPDFITSIGSQNIKKLEEYMKNEAARRLPILVANKKEIIEELFSGDIVSSDLVFLNSPNEVKLSISSTTIKTKEPTTIIITILAVVGINKDQASNQYTHEITGFTTPIKAILFSLLRNYITTAQKEIPSYNSSIIKSNKKANDIKVNDFKILNETTFQGKKIIFSIKSVVVNSNDPTKVIVTIGATTTDKIGNQVTKTYNHDVDGFANLARLKIIEKVKNYIKDPTSKLKYNGAIAKNKMATTKLVKEDFDIIQPLDSTISVSIEDVQAKSMDVTSKDQRIAFITLFVAIGDRNIPNLFYKEKFIKEVGDFAEIAYGENNFKLQQYLKEPISPVLISPSIKNKKSPIQIVLKDLTIQEKVFNGQITLKIIKVKPNVKSSKSVDVSVKAIIGTGANTIYEEYTKTINDFISNDQWLINQFVSKEFIPTIFFSRDKILAKSVADNNDNFGNYQLNLQKILPSELEKSHFTFNNVNLNNKISTIADSSFDFEIDTFKNNVPIKQTIFSSLFKFNFEILRQNDQQGTLTIKIIVSLNNSQINPSWVSKDYDVTFTNIRRLETSKQRKVRNAPELAFVYKGSKNEISASELSISNFELINKPILGLNYLLDSDKGVQALNNGKSAKLTITVLGEKNSKKYEQTISGFLTSKKSKNRKAVLNVLYSNEKPEPPIINTKKTIAEFIDEFNAASDDEKFKLYVNLNEIPSKHNPGVKVKPLRVESNLDKAINVFQLSQGNGDDIFIQEYEFVNSAFWNGAISSLNKIRNNITIKAIKARNNNTPMIQLLKINNNLVNKLAIPKNISNTSFIFDLKKINAIVGIDNFDTKFTTKITLKPWKKEFTTFGFYRLEIEIIEIVSTEKIVFDVDVYGFATVDSLVKKYIEDKTTWRLPKLVNDVDKWNSEASPKRNDYTLNTNNMMNGLKIEIKDLFIKQDDKSIINFIVEVSREALVNWNNKEHKFYSTQTYNPSIKYFKKPFFKDEEAYRIQIKKDDGTLINKYVSKANYDTKYKNNDNEAAKIKKLEIRSNQIVIQANQFKNLTNLSELILNEGIENIEIEAFANSSLLVSIKLPSSIKTIGDKAFNKSKLTSLSDLEKTSLMFLDKTVFEEALQEVQDKIKQWKIKKIKNFKLIRIENLKIKKKPSEIEIENDFKWDLINNLDIIKKNNALIKFQELTDLNDVLGSFKLSYSINIEKPKEGKWSIINSKNEIEYLSNLTKFAKENHALSVMDPTYTNLVKFETVTLDGRLNQKAVSSIADFRSKTNNEFIQNNIENRPQYAIDLATGQHVLRFSAHPKDLNRIARSFNDRKSANDYISNLSFENSTLDQGVIYFVFKDTTLFDRQYITLSKNEWTILYSRSENIPSLSLTKNGQKDVIDVLSTNKNSWGNKNKWKILEITKLKVGEQKFQFRIFHEEKGKNAEASFFETNYDFERFWEINGNQFGLRGRSECKEVFDSFKFSKNIIGSESSSFVGDIGAFVVFDDVIKNSNFAKDLAKRDQFVNILKEKWFGERE